MMIVNDEHGDTGFFCNEEYPCADCQAEAIERAMGDRKMNDLEQAEKLRHDREVCETVKLLHPRIWARMSNEDKRTLADIIEGRIDRRAVDKALRMLHNGHLTEAS